MNLTFGLSVPQSNHPQRSSHLGIEIPRIPTLVPKTKPLTKKTFDALSHTQKQSVRSYFEKRLHYPLGQQEYLNWFFVDTIVPEEFPDTSFFLVYAVDIILHNEVTLGFNIFFESPEEVNRLIDYAYGERCTSSPIDYDNVKYISILAISGVPEGEDILVTWEAKEKGKTIFSDGFSEDSVKDYITRQFRPFFEGAVEWLENKWAQIKEHPDAMIEEYINGKEFYVNGEGVVYIGADRYVEYDADDREMELYEVDVESRCDSVK
jgi:hypothetical protein